MVKYKITSKTYFNSRLKKVIFRGKEIYPLYIQLTYQRRSIFFKSQYFERHIDSATVTLDDIKVMESKVIEHIVSTNGNFSLEEFSLQYNFWTKPTAVYATHEFAAWIEKYFIKFGASSFGALFKNTTDSEYLYRVYLELKQILPAASYKQFNLSAHNNNLIFIVGLPFIHHVLKDSRLLNFDWYDRSIQKKFKAYLEKTYGNQKEIYFSKIKNALFPDMIV